MINENVMEAFRDIAIDMIDLFKYTLTTDVGINKKVGKNTLAKSRLSRMAAVDATEFPIIHLLINDYIEEIESGRKRKARLVPIAALRDWARRKGIKSDNVTLERIQYAIWRDGISPRPVMSVFFNLLDKEWSDTYADMLFDAITENLNNIFND